MSHPLQSQMWTMLLRVQCNKHWAIDLACSESEVSRWATGTRAMSIDDLVACVRVLSRLRRGDVAARVRGWLGDEAGDPATTSPVSTALDAAEAGGATARALREALADGRISVDEAVEIERAAERHADVARDLRRIAAEARRTSAA